MLTCLKKGETISICIIKLMEILKKDLFPAHLIERVINRCITGTLSNHCPQGSLPTTATLHRPFSCRHSEKDSSLYQALLQ